jgi:two-component system chemotaxis response regulator CheY
MSLNVLVVDDSSVMRAMVIKTLRLSGVAIDEIHQAANGQQALELLDQKWIDLAMVDINMPVMNGLELLERLRKSKEFAKLPVIVVSTESSKTRIEMLEQNGAIFIHKPFTPEMLREAIVTATGVS